MPVLKKMKQTMLAEKMPDEIISQIDFADTNGNDPQPVIAAVDQMDALLSHDRCLSVMEKQGCCKSGKRDKDCKAFGKQHKDKPLAEKLALLSTIENMMQPQLNEDGTITVNPPNERRPFRMILCL